MSLIDDLENLYENYTNNTFSFLAENGIYKTEITSLMLLYDTFYYNIDDTIQFFLCEHYLNKQNLINVLNKPLNDFFSFYTQICFDNKYIGFIQTAAKIYLENYNENPNLAKYEKPELPKCEKPGTAFVDLISGFNFSHFFPTLEKSTEYFLIDKSIMTCELLELKRQEYQLDNVHILCKDIDDLMFSDISHTVEILRVKNPFRYISDFKGKIEKFKDIISPGGRFIFQEQSIEKTICFEMYKDIESYFEGWEKEIQILITQNPNLLDTIVFRKS